MIVEIKDGKVYVAPGMFLVHKDGTPVTEKEWFEHMGEFNESNCDN